MSGRFTETDVISIVTRLTRSQLVRYVEVAFIRPHQGDDGFVFSSADIARLELLCDLTQDLELDETGLHVVISLIDQLHAARQDLAHIAQAFEALPDDLRDRVAVALKQN